MPSSEFDVLQAANDPRRLSQLGMSRGQMLEYGLNLKRIRDGENEMALELGKLGGGINKTSSAFRFDYPTIASAQSAYDISKDPNKLKALGISARQAIEFWTKMAEDEYEVDKMGGYLKDMLSRQKQKSMIGQSYGRLTAWSLP